MFYQFRQTCANRTVMTLIEKVILCPIDKSTGLSLNLLRIPTIWTTELPQIVCFSLEVSKTYRYEGYVLKVNVIHNIDNTGLSPVSQEVFTLMLEVSQLMQTLLLWSRQ